MTAYNLNNESEALLAVARFEKLLSKRAEIELTEKRKSKTVPQLRYIHKAIDLLADYMGHEDYEYEYVKDAIKIELGYYTIIMGRQVPMSFADFDVKMAQEFIDKFVRWAAFKGFVILLPDEYYENKHQLNEYIEANKRRV